MQKDITRFGADLPAAYFRIARVQTGKEIGITPDVKIHASHDQAVTDVGLPDPWRCDFSFGTPITGTDPIGPTLALLKILPNLRGRLKHNANASL
ncbi:MAG: hypothetical protein ACJ8AI_18210 [Rhodopila sp.]